jgi:hypothetical protein
VPVVRLKKEHYQHKSYGRIFTPVFELVRWTGIDTAEPADASEGQPEEEAAPVEEPRRRRRAI